MEGRNPFAVNVVCTPPQRELKSDFLRRSPWLIAFGNLTFALTSHNIPLSHFYSGILQQFPSLLLIRWSVWIFTRDISLSVAFVSFLCGGVHLAVGILAIIGGRRIIIISCLVMGIIASCIFTPVTVVTTLITKRDFETLCTTCEFMLNTTCPNECNNVEPEALFDPVLILSLLTSIIAVVLSSVSCCNICNCCGCCYKVNRAQNFQITYHPVSTFPQMPPPPPTYWDVLNYDERSSHPHLTRL